ncbi:MAG: prepilin-type N-terminal cleavage/methylation domain-containing protein [Candidatus Eremiobacteraeota bacterium]|nr:prepilin-type N-terminal cleavage/methylation domain-containing protein [Candidatus Eremiobacteraeota bacterium]
MMKTLRELRKSHAFTIIELVVVIAIVAVIFTFGMAYYRKYTVQKRFQTDFDKLVGTLKEAQIQARAYGKDSENYAGTGSMLNGQQREKYLCRMVMKTSAGVAKYDRIDEFKDVKLFFQAGNAPMSDTRLLTQYEGVAVTFGCKNGDDYTYDCVLLFGPDGTLYFPSGYVGKTMYIEMRTADSSMIRRVIIDQTTGTITTQTIK